MRLPAKWKYPQLREGLVGAWCSSQGATGDKLFDRSGYGNHGTLTSMDPATDWVSSGTGLALDFDGVDNSVDIVFNHAAYPFTMACWVRPAVTASTSVFMTLGINATAYVYFCIEQRGSVFSIVARNTGFNNAAGTTASTAGTWQHVAGIFESATSHKLYVNGKLEATQTVSVPIATANRIFIGKLRNTDTSGIFQGQVDDSVFYSRALSPSEVAILAQRRGILYETMPTRYRMRGSGAAPPTFTGRNMLVGCAF